MSTNKKLRLRARRLAFLGPIALLTTALSGGIAHATPSVYPATGVLGQSSFTAASYGDAADQLEYPNDTVIDTVHHRLFVADYENDRIQVYQLDNNDQIVSQTANYALGAPNPSSAGTDTDNINSFIDAPFAMAYDTVNNRLFVEDEYRVLVFNLANGISNDMNASNVLGQTNFTDEDENTSINGLDDPGRYGGGLAFDPTNDRLFVSDDYRIVVYNVAPTTITNGENASYVLGQTNFTNTDAACTQSELDGAYYDETSFSLAFDTANQRLFVSDGDDCSRVLIFNVAPTTITNGENASYVLGQPDFTTHNFNTTQNSLNAPDAIGYDPTTNTLFVGDYYGLRIMLFNVSPATLASDENAYAVLGQPDFASLTSGTSQSALDYDYYGAGGYAIDPTNNQLFLPDQFNNRVLTYNFITMTNTSQLNPGTIGQSYSQTLTSVNAQGTVSYSVTGGSLPPGLSLDAATGKISGSPTTAGTYRFEITAYDAIGAAGTLEDDPSYTITIGGGTAAAASSVPDTGFGKPVNHTAIYGLATIAFLATIITSSGVLISKRYSAHTSLKQ